MLVPIVLGLGVVVTAVLGGGVGAPGAERDRAVAVATATPRAAVPSPRPRPDAGVRAAASSDLPAPPSIVHCGPLSRFDCRRAVVAAVSILVRERRAIVSADVSASLICGDVLDCPASLLDRARPVGSVVLTFDDAATAWVNVVEPGPDGVREGSPRALIASVVRRFG